MINNHCSEKEIPLLTGNIQKIRIVSNTIKSFLKPGPDDEVEQHLTITKDGRIFFSSYNYGDGSGKLKKRYTHNFKVDRSKTWIVLALLKKYFSEKYKYEILLDGGGYWKAWITNDNGRVFKFENSLCVPDVYDIGINLSNMVRRQLGMNNLYVFDGNF